MRSLAAQVREKALELGFCKVGIVPAQAMAKESTRLLEWLDRGFHGKMAWMNREPERRGDPKLIFPEAKSVIVVALNYFTPHEHEDSPSEGKISRYAWGDDYHPVLQEKLYAFLEWIRSESPGSDGKVCVDTTPLLEKAWAVRAGIGWAGKHSNVITTDHGSWVFLGEIILNIDLEYDTEIVADHCGSCTACIDACPTNAIVEPYVVDSNKCISHATIELRDETLPADISTNLNGWLYGCDICQDVCPWNRFEKPTEDARFEPRRNETSIHLGSLETMTPDEYIERFRGSAMKRAKLTGLKRNAAALSDPAA
jgi:epoxyqueuosine reductase